MPKLKFEGSVSKKRLCPGKIKQTIRCTTDEDNMSIPAHKIVHVISSLGDHHVTSSWHSVFRPIEQNLQNLLNSSPQDHDLYRNIFPNCLSIVSWSQNSFQCFHQRGDAIWSCFWDFRLDRYFIL